MCLYRELFELRHKTILYKRGTCQGQTQKSGLYLKTGSGRLRSRKAVRNANNYKGPERDVWDKLENKKEINSNSGKKICQERAERKQNFLISFLALFSVED